MTQFFTRGHCSSAGPEVDNGKRGRRLRQRLRPLTAEPGNACGEARLASAACARVRLRKPVRQY
eukprot:8572504-Alexandrium_andersonii.AAC.1